jgi:hypothetical protein
LESDSSIILDNSQSSLKKTLVSQPDRQVQVVDLLEDKLIVPEFAESIKLTAGIDLYRKTESGSWEIINY